MTRNPTGLSLVYEYCSLPFQVASHLHPRDVMHLSRATKHFNGMLMSRNSRPVWRAAFENVDVPECPDDLSDPLYAALLYDHFCMVRESDCYTRCWASLKRTIILFTELRLVYEM